MKGTMKLLLVLLLAVTTLTVFTSTCYASEIGNLLKPTDVNIDYGKAEDTQPIMDMAGKIIGLIRNIAVIAGIVLLSVLGLKYMFGSAEEKAGYQKSFVPLIVGIVLVMSATTIASLIFSML